MTGRWTVGIDPGATGAIATITDDDCLFGLLDMPVDGGQIMVPILADHITEMATLAADYDADVTVWVEQVGSMPGQGVASTFKFGQNYGTILGVVGALRLRAQLVRPATWKRAMGVTKEKGTSRRLAAELWPGEAGMFKRVKDDGRAEAALIARYGLLQHRQGLA